MEILKHIEVNLQKTVRFNQQDKGEFIGLPYPYTAPCVEEMFTSMYYWDTYFTNLGLISIGMAQQAKYNVDNMLYMVEKFGFMLNGNMTRYLNRSQPPFLCFMVKDVFEYFDDKQWLESVYKTLCKEYNFWQTERQSENGLNFYGNYKAMEDKVLTNQYYNAFSERSGGYTTGDPDEKQKIANTFMTHCESGWDCCSRFDFDGQFINPVCLNSLLYGFEAIMCEFSRVLGLNDESLLEKRAATRKAKMQKYLWNEKEQLFMDWNFKDNRHSKVKSVASLYPMFVKLVDDVKGEKQLLADLTLHYGIACSVKDNYRFPLQWDYPNVWAPLQFMAYTACKNYGLNEKVNDIARRYINLIETNFEKTGNLWEKYDGNTGKVANQDYDAPTMMGWTAGVYLRFKYDLKEI
ncbi:MAG: hypothetical protein IJD00_00880 [Clostridia bacterium]|nr:hypothetical protein [Clostridia bacterium]